MLAMRSFANNFKMAPIKITGRITVPNFNLKPSKTTNHPVIVVPVLAPKIIPRDCGNVISPAPTKPTAVTVTALDDCNTAVHTAPVKAPDTGLLVSFFKALRIAFPCKLRNAPVITIIPNKKIPSPPSA